jgi:TonB family protein
LAIRKIKVSANKVELSGFRVAEVFDSDKLKFVPVHADQDVQIVVDRDASPDDTAELVRRRKLQETSVLEITVSPQGNPVDILVTRPLGFDLDDRAVVVVQSWKFQPATLKGQPVPVRVNIEVSFRLC